MGVAHRRVVALAAVGLIALAACGGSDEADDPGFSDGGGDQEIRLGGELPDGFPDDFYFPDAMTVRGATRTDDLMSVVGTYEDGSADDIEAIQAEIVAGLQAAGYELLTEGDIAAFVKDGLGRVRVRTSVFVGELTTTIDIDLWTDEQIDELRALFEEPVSVRGRATAEVDGERLEAEGECMLQGTNRSFFADDVSITLQIDETRDPTYVYADVTTPGGRVLYTELDADLSYESSPDRFSASGEMIDNAGGPGASFTVEATCDR